MKILDHRIHSRVSMVKRILFASAAMFPFSLRCVRLHPRNRASESGTSRPAVERAEHFPGDVDACDLISSFRGLGRDRAGPIPGSNTRGNRAGGTLPGAWPNARSIIRGLAPAHNGEESGPANVELTYSFRRPPAVGSYEAHSVRRRSAGAMRWLPCFGPSFRLSCGQPELQR